VAHEASASKTPRRERGWALKSQRTTSLLMRRADRRRRAAHPSPHARQGPRGLHL